jgi:3-oxocholest-4-en-26-oate---CoA ligase
MSTGDSVGCTGSRDPVPEGQRGARSRGRRRAGGEDSIVSAWNYADVWEAVADSVPDSGALTQGKETRTWAEFDRRADHLARWLLGSHVAHQDKVALFLYNCPEYLEATFACLKVGLVPINTNYRYGEDELVYLWENADAVVAVFHGVFSERIEALRARVPGVRDWLWVDDGTASCPEWAVPYEEAAETTGAGTGHERVRAPWDRGPDDLFMLYTGGTTGLPKGVMWRQDDLFARLNGGGFRRYPPDGTPEDVRSELATSGPGMTLLPACPFMHGTGGFSSLECLSEGGRVVTLVSRTFDPIELLEIVERERVNGLVIVGDAFAKPILGALDAEPGRFDLSSLVGMISSGVMWSEETKQGLLRHHPGMLLVDAFSSSEALGMGTSVSSARGAVRTARFTLGPEVRVIDADGHDVTPGSGRPGVLALGGRIPLGYYKDEAKSAATFRIIDGARYSVPGDFAEVAEDGTIHLLGRGSVCINTGGEKVYPEEVEEVLKTATGVVDAVVVGIPNERFGEEIVAVVELAPGTVAADDADRAIVEHVKARLAGFKAPRRVRFVETIGRAPSGKVDYKRHRRESAEWLGVELT